MAQLLNMAASAYNTPPVNQSEATTFNAFYVPPVDADRKVWCRMWLDRISNYAIAPGLLQRRLKYAEFFNLADGIFNVNDYAYVWATFGNAKPMTFTNYPLLSVLVDALVGDWQRNNLAFSVLKVNPDAVSEKMNLTAQMLFMQLVKPYWDKIEKAIGTPLNLDDKMQAIPPDAKKYMTYDYRDMQEQTVYDGLNYIIERHDEKSEFSSVLKDITICNDGYGKLTFVDGDPVVKRIHPMFALVDVGVNDYSDFKILDKELDSFGEERYLTHSEVLYNYGYWMSDTDKLQLKQMVEGFMSGAANNMAVINNITYFRKEEGTIRIRCVEGQWKARNSRPFPKDFDPITNQPKSEALDIFDVYEGVKIGATIYCKCQRKKNILRNGDNYRKAQLDYFGILTKYGIYPKAAPLQMLYNIVMSHIEFAINQAGGKAMTIYLDDVPLGEDGKPKYEIDDLVYMAKVQGIILKQRKEGVPLSGYADNYQQVDFGLSSTINNLYLFKGMIEQTASRMTGISPDRFGFTKSDQAVGVTQNNVAYSSTATAPLFYAHTKMVECGLQKAADLMKVVWAKDDYRCYVVGDLGMKVIQMNDSLSLADYGIFCRNSMEDAMKIKRLEGYAEAAISTNPEMILEAIKISNAGTSVRAEKIIEEAVGNIRQLNQQQQQMQAQQAQAQQQILAQQIQLKHQEANDANDTKEKVAEIMAGATIQKATTDLRAAENVKIIEKETKLAHQQLKDVNQNSMNEDQRDHEKQMQQNEPKNKQQ